MFALFISAKENSIIKVLLKETAPDFDTKFYLVYRLVYISDSMGEFRQLSIKNIVVSS